MGESQCPHCGHIVTGFEDQDFAAKQREWDTITRALDEAVAREAVMREAMAQITCICGSGTREHEDEYRTDVDHAYAVAAHALATPSPRAEALMRVVEAAVEYVHDTRDATFDALEDHVRAYQEGSND